MCLTVKYNTNEEALQAKERPLVADRNIRVYKTVRAPYPTHPHIYLSIYQYFSYERGQRYSTDMKPINWGRGKELEINDGFHSYRRKKGTKWERKSGYFMVKMIIPKGALYYTDGKEYASNAIVFPKRKIWF